MRYSVVVEIMLSNGNTRARSLVMEKRDLADALNCYEVQFPTVTFEHEDGRNVFKLETIQEISATPIC